MAERLNGGPFFLAPGARLYVGYWWGDRGEQAGEDRGGQYAYGRPMGTEAQVISFDQRVYWHDAGRRLGDQYGWEYGVSVRNDGPGVTYVDVYAEGM